MYKLVSAKQVIAKVYRDLRLSDSRYVTDMVEWIGEVIKYINAWPNLERKVVFLEVEMHRAKLPDNLSYIHQVARSYDSKGTVISVMKYNSSSFPRSLHTSDSPNKCIQQSENRYIINHNYIETNFERGLILLSYDRFPVDDEGFPFISEQVSFQEACKWFIALRMCEGGWTHPAGLSYSDIEARWLKYCSQAREIFKMPTIDQYQNFLENWVRLVPDYSRHEMAFDPFMEVTYDNNFPDPDPDPSPEPSQPDSPENFKMELVQ